MPEEFSGKEEELLRDYFDSGIKKIPILNEPDWQLYEKPGLKKLSWIPSLVFNLVLAALVVGSVPFINNRKPELAKKIEILTDKYKINEKIIDGLYALKGKL